MTKKFIPKRKDPINLEAVLLCSWFRLTDGNKSKIDAGRLKLIYCLKSSDFLRRPKRFRPSSTFYLTLLSSVKHGCVKSTVIERRQHQLGRMADIPPPVTFSVFDL